MCGSGPRVADLFPARREILKLGGLALAGSFANQAIWPLAARANGRANPRGSARYCIFIEMGGAISPMDTWDFKETRWTPPDLDLVRVNDEVSLSRTLFPRLAGRMDEVALVRSMRAPELIHFNGQYHTQTGRALNVALAREIPAFGSVIAAELDAERRESDSFPTYVSTYLTRARAGSIGAGFLPTRFSGLDLDPTTVFESVGGDVEGSRRVLEERYRLLNQLAETRIPERASLGDKEDDYRDYYRAAYGPPDRSALAAGVRGNGNRPGSATARTSSGARVHPRPEPDRSRRGDPVHLHLRRRQVGPPRGHLRPLAPVEPLHDLSPAGPGVHLAARRPRGRVPGSEEGKTLLDETLIVVASEFGRTPEMNPVAGRDHYRFAYTSMFAGGGVAGGRVVGRTNEDGSEVVDPGWKHAGQPFMDNVVATIYSALGIDWRKSVTNTPSGRELPLCGLGLARRLRDDVRRRDRGDLCVGDPRPLGVFGLAVGALGGALPGGAAAPHCSADRAENICWIPPGDF